MLGALAGGVSGAFGYLLAGKFHGLEKGEKIYPAYALTLFVALLMAAKFYIL